jgi:CUG-BP- and ETR3-like factor
MGCDPDAIKLFVGNLPRSCTEQQLLQLFETIGQIVELVIVRDRVTQETKGSAFVWYTTRALAERAILQFNLRHCLPDQAGEQDRPLVVRKAKTRKLLTGQAVGMIPGSRMAHSMEQQVSSHHMHVSC